MFSWCSKSILHAFSQTMLASSDRIEMLFRLKHSHCFFAVVKIAGCKDAMLKGNKTPYRTAPRSSRCPCQCLIGCMSNAGHLNKFLTNFHSYKTNHISMSSSMTSHQISPSSMTVEPAHLLHPAAPSRWSPRWCQRECLLTILIAIFPFTYSEEHLECLISPPKK